MKREKHETKEEKEIELVEELPQVPLTLCHHALIVGYGRVGRLLYEQLIADGLTVVVVENSRSRIDEMREKGILTIYGNAARPEVMALMRLDCAQWLLLTIPNGYESGEIAATAREQRPDLAIFARAHHDDEVDYLHAHGCDHIVMGEREIAYGLQQAVQRTLPQQQSAFCPLN